MTPPKGRGGSWSKEGVILFTPSIREPLFRVSEAGGTPTQATRLESQPAASHRWPYFLPDGRHFLFLSRGKTEGIYAGTLDSEESKLILEADSNAAYSPTGQLLWWREGILMAQPFDASRLQLTGGATPVGERVLFSRGQSFAVFSVSHNGILAFQSGETIGSSQLTWFDRSGKQLGKVSERQFFGHPRISPDGQKIAVGITDPTGEREDIWLYDVSKGILTRLTFSQSARFPVWSPDGSRIAYASLGAHFLGLVVKSANGAGQEQVLLNTPGLKIPWSWSMDGRFLAYVQRGPQPVTDKFDIWILPLFGDGKPFPFLQSDFSKTEPAFSPDARWIAYTSTESGAPEVYVASFPNPSTKFQVSNQGGQSPVWRADGKELFYISRRELMAVSLSNTSSSLQSETPHALFTTGPLVTGDPSGLGTEPFDLSRRDQRFVIVTTGNTDPSPITVVVNWDAELKKK